MSSGWRSPRIPAYLLPASVLLVLSGLWIFVAGDGPGDLGPLLVGLGSLGLATNWLIRKPSRLLAASPDPTQTRTFHYDRARMAYAGVLLSAVGAGIVAASVWGGATGAPLWAAVVMGAIGALALAIAATGLPSP